MNNQPFNIDLESITKQVIYIGYLIKALIPSIFNFCTRKNPPPIASYLNVPHKVKICINKNIYN